MKQGVTKTQTSDPSKLEIKDLPPFSLTRNFGKQNKTNFRQSWVLLTDRIEIHQSEPDSIT